MLDVEFLNENSSGSRGNLTSRSVFNQTKTPKMVGWIMKIGVKDKNTAERVLVGIAIVSFILTFIIIKFLYSRQIQMLFIVRIYPKNN